MKKILIPLTALLATAAGAAPKITPQSIVVNPLPANVAVNVWTDRDASGQGTPNYAVGDKIRIYTSVSQDAYVYLFNVNPNGSIDQILPNRLGGDNFVKANTVKVFPDSNANFTFDIAAPYGVNKVLALASQTQLNLDQISSFTTGGQFAQVNVQGQQQLAQALSIVVNPIPQNSWITDTAQYNVVPGVAATQPRPTPVRPTPAPPVVTYPTPDWNQTNRWDYSFTGNNSLSSVYNFYVNQLSRQGYRLTDSRQRGNQVTARFVKGGGEATLNVKQTGSRFQVRIERRS